jgi:uncharacterized membrane protein
MQPQTAIDHPAPSASDEARAPIRAREPAQHDLAPAPSTAAIAGHPIHPMLVPFPVALLTLVAVTDIVYAVNESLFWSSVSYYMLWAGLISAGVAAIFGLIDFTTIKRAREHRAGWAHLLLNVAIVLLSLVNLLLRWGNDVELIVPSGMLVSIVAAGLLMVSGWYGGELAYRHKVGVIG